LIFIASFDQFFLIESTEIGGFNWDKILNALSINIFIILGVISLIAIWDIVTDVKRLMRD
jgi:hypothetical protein